MPKKLAKTKKKIKKLSDKEKLKLISKWSDWFYNHTDSYAEGTSGYSIGIALAYLWPAIVKDSFIEADAEEELVHLLDDNGVPRNDEIWRFIQVI